MRPPDDGPTVPVRVMPEDFHRVAQQFAGTADEFEKLRENLRRDLAPAAGWAGIDDQAQRFGYQFTNAYLKVEDGIERARNVLYDIGQGIDLSARNHWLADQAAVPGNTPAEPPWTTAPPGPFIPVESRPFPMCGNTTGPIPAALARKVPMGDPDKLRIGARAFYTARDTLDAMSAGLYQTLYGLFANNDSEDLRALDEFWQRVGGPADTAILTALRDACDELGQALDEFANWIVDTTNEINRALGDALKTVAAGALLALLLAALTEGIGALFGAAEAGGDAGALIVAIDGVVTAAGVTGRAAAVGAAAGGVISLMQAAINNTPSPNLNPTDPQVVVTDSQITTAAEDAADIAGGPAEEPGSAGEGEVPTPHGRPGTVDDLNAQQLANYNRYVKKLPAKAEPPQIEILKDGGVRISSRVPANNIPGSYADYIKIVDRDGNTVQYVKNTYDPSGRIVHSKVK